MVHIRKIKNGDFIFLVSLILITLTYAEVKQDDKPVTISNEEKEELKEEARDMFYHAYRAYMENAYPADELMPLSCQGRWRDSSNSRGDLDDVLGNFSLTLIDSLDTLVILGDLEEFEHAIKLVIKGVSFEQDVVVSVFETNIRVLGGLISAHILAEYLQQRAGIIEWYQSELLTLAKDLGYRLLPAFNTTTGIPHPRINLKHGLKNMRLSAYQETCTACAGTMILELAALSRLTGEPVFEEKAHKAMDELWRMRHRSSDLMGTVLNVESGDWVRRDSGVGAGIDSYYEYCLKAYILLGDDRYLGRFNRHYNAVMKYVSQGPLLVDVHMHRPHTNSKNFMDALLAFWPGLQVLKGDIKPAVATHEMLYQVMQRHNLLPEAFTTDFQVHWAQHPLRPEFVESTYFLYKATNDPYYLEVGRDALKSLQKYARVPCGYATVKDVRTGGHDDRMDSFVLAETFKYLFLLFADPAELVLDLDEFLFTTEAHLLPLTLSRNHYANSSILSQHQQRLQDDDVDLAEFSRSCPNSLNLFPESVRKPLKNMVDGICPRRTVKRKLLASQFVSGNQDHLKLLKDMGITVMSLTDGRVQLLHSIGSARSSTDAEEGLLFMQEMVELSQNQKQVTDKQPLTVHYKCPDGVTKSISAGPAHFGKELTPPNKVSGFGRVAVPFRACDALLEPEQLKGKIIIVERGDCMFINKVRRIEEAGGVGAIVIDNTPGTSSMTSSMFAMSGDGTNDVSIPAVFLFYQDASHLFNLVKDNPHIEISISESATTVDNGDVCSSEKSGVKSTVEEILKPFDLLSNNLKLTLQELLKTKDKAAYDVNSGVFKLAVDTSEVSDRIITVLESERNKLNEDKFLYGNEQNVKKSMDNGGDDNPLWLVELHKELGLNKCDNEKVGKLLYIQTKLLFPELDLLINKDGDKFVPVDKILNLEHLDVLARDFEENAKVAAVDALVRVMPNQHKSLPSDRQYRPIDIEKWLDLNYFDDLDRKKISDATVLFERLKKLDLLKYLFQKLIKIPRVCDDVTSDLKNDNIIVKNDEL